MKHRRYIGIVMVLLFMVAWSGLPAQAKSVSDDCGVEVNMPAFLRLEIFFWEEGSEPRVPLEDAEGLIFSEALILEAMLASPFIEEPDELFQFNVQHEDWMEIVTYGNMPHQLTISAGASFFDGPDETLLPVSRLEWRMREEEEDWQPLSIENVTVFTQGEVGSHTVFLEWQLWLELVDPIGDYDGEIIFTLSGLS